MSLALEPIRTMLMYGVIPDGPNSGTGATVSDVAEAAEALLSEVGRLRAERAALVDVAEAAEALDHHHHDTCDAVVSEPGDCTCGIVAVLEALDRLRLNDLTPS